MPTGLHFFHEGQLEGRRIKISMHLDLRPEEPVAPALKDFYQKLLACPERPAVRDGRWQPLEVSPAWEGNPTWDRFLAFNWEGEVHQRLLNTVNYGPTQGQCYVSLPFVDLFGNKVKLQDLMSEACYERDGQNLRERGLYLDLPPWGFHMFAW